MKLRGFSIRVVKTPARAPTANVSYERLIGTIRRECLNYVLTLNERHMNSFVNPHCHLLPTGYRVASTPILGGLHHEYRLEKEAV